LDSGNLLVPPPSIAMGGLPPSLPLRSHGRVCDLLPDLQSRGHLLAALGGKEPGAFRSEGLGNGAIGLAAYRPANAHGFEAFCGSQNVVFLVFSGLWPLTPLLKVGEARPLIVNTTETRRVDLIVIGAYSKRNSPN
jgi:hypothetical protein